MAERVLSDRPNSGRPEALSVGERSAVRVSKGRESEPDDDKKRPFSRDSRTRCVVGQVCNMGVSEPQD